MRFNAKFAIAIALVFTINLTSSCSFDTEEPFRVGSNFWPGYETLYLARSLGEFVDSDIRLVELPNASEVIQALRNGMLEAAALTLDEALTVVQDDYDLKIVLVMDFSAGGDALLATPTISRLNELREKRIGVENTAVGAILLDAALERAGLSMPEVKLESMTVDEHVDAYKTQRIDAVVTFEPARTQLLSLGARSLFDSSQIPERIIDVLVVRSDVVERKHASIRRLLRGHFAALTYQKAHPHEASVRISARLGVPADSVLTIYKGLNQPDLKENQELLLPPATRFQTQMRDLVELMLARNMLHRKPDLDDLVDGRWLPPTP